MLSLVVEGSLRGGVIRWRLSWSSKMVDQSTRWESTVTPWVSPLRQPSLRLRDVLL